MIDQPLLEAHGTYVDVHTGITERFLTPTLGGLPTVAVLTQPAGTAREVGWVLCHAFGIEQIHLDRLNVIAARALARAGFTVLRYQGRGYGDSFAGPDSIDLTTHLEDAAEAVSLLGSFGVERIGTGGARWGATVATLTADRLDLPLLIAWEPLIRGDRYVRDLFRQAVLSEMANGGDQSGDRIAALRSSLQDDGVVDLQGLLLSQAAHDQMAAVDLTKDLTRFSGRALVMSVARGDAPSTSSKALAARLEALGAQTDLQVVSDPAAPQFGQFRWHAVAGTQSKRDVQLELNESMAASTVAWAAPLAVAAPTGREARS